MNLLEQAMHKKSMNESAESSPANAASTDNRASLIKPHNRAKVVPAILIVLAVSAIWAATASYTGKSSPVANTGAPSPAVGQTFEREQKQNIKEFVESWARAWSEKDGEKYLSSYAPDFEPAPGISHSDWVKQRRLRLNKYKKIEVLLTNLKISEGKDTVEVEFLQTFKGDSFLEKDFHKRLIIKFQDSRWMIVKEMGI